jgi:hypothetical protein
LLLPGDVVEEGQWVKGKLTGQGKRTYPDGRTLEGEFRESSGRVQGGQTVGGAGYADDPWYH